MDTERGRGEPIYRVVVNGEEQYSIWPRDRELPPGWRDPGFAGSRSECLARIEAIWLDMRPRSLRAGGSSEPAA